MTADSCRETGLEIARAALAAVKRIEALAAVPGASRELIIATRGARELVAPLEAEAAALAAAEFEAGMLTRARRSGFREGVAHAEAQAAERQAEDEERRSGLRLVAGHA